MNLFGYHNLQESVFEKRLYRLRHHIESQPDNYILNVNETEYLKFLVNEFRIDNLELDFENSHVRISDFNTMSYQPPPNRGEKITYCIPYKGDGDLLYYYPDMQNNRDLEATVGSGCVCFNVTYEPNRKEQLQEEIEIRLSKIKAMAAVVRERVAQYNNSLPEQASNIFHRQKNYLLEKYNLIKALNVPVYKRTDLPQTFAVPAPETRKKICLKPIAAEINYTPEPTLEQSTYESILQYIHDWGKQFERMPSLYRGRLEPHLRDLFLLLIEPHFIGTATGETFNKEGKTDILLRHEGKNVFVAEFKMWSGEKDYLKAINQLLGYLTFRDSKAAIVLFVRNKGISEIFKIVEKITPTHNNYLGFVGRYDESWFNYRFHITGDQSREVRIAILLFHIP